MDLNHRPQDYEPRELPDCSTPLALSYHKMELYFNRIGVKLEKKRILVKNLIFITNPANILYRSFAFLAQGLEHRICNATVVGSNPTEGFVFPM